MLIYIPTNSRAAVAILICVIACCNLNYFAPHKNKVLFWLTELSFITTSAKYTIATLIASSTDEQQDQQMIGSLLIVLDVGFMVSSIFAILISLYVLRLRVWAIVKEAKTNQKKGSSSSLTQVQPIDAATENTLIGKKEDGQENSNAKKQEYNQLKTWGK